MIGFEFSSSAASDRAGCYHRISWLSDPKTITHTKTNTKTKKHTKIFLLAEDKDTHKDKDKRKPPIGFEFSASAGCILCASWFRLQGRVNQGRVNHGRMNQGRVGESLTHWNHGSGLIELCVHMKPHPCDH